MNKSKHFLKPFRKSVSELSGKVRFMYQEKNVVNLALDIFVPIFHISSHAKKGWSY